MIVIRVELWPYGFEEQKETLGTAVIFNNGTGTKSSGNYRAIFGKRGQDLLKTIRGRRPWREVEVKDFPRERLLGWDLVFRALRAAVGDRNP